MKYRILSTLVGVLLSSNMLFSQTNATTKEKSLEEKLEGTYVLIQSSLKYTELVTNDILIEIEKRRDEKEDIYYQISEYLTIRILPRQIISAPNFDPKKYQ
jgi:hypothetical protein